MKRLTRRNIKNPLQLPLRGVSDSNDDVVTDQQQTKEMHVLLHRIVNKRRGNKAKKSQKLLEKITEAHQNLQVLHLAKMNHQPERTQIIRPKKQKSTQRQTKITAKRTNKDSEDWKFGKISHLSERNVQEMPKLAQTQPI